jgi:hypothetical protein
MRPDLQDEMLTQKKMLDTTGAPIKGDDGKDITLSKDDVDKLTKLKNFLDSLEPENNDKFFDAFVDLENTFGDKGASDVLNYANPSNNFPELDILKRIYATAGSLQNFATAYEALQETADYKGTDPAKIKAAKGAQAKLTNTISNLKQETGASNNDIMKIFGYILNKYNFTFEMRG